MALLHSSTVTGLAHCSLTRLSTTRYFTDLNKWDPKVAISQYPRCAKPIPIDVDTYRRRHLIKSFFCDPKEFKRIALRACQINRSFEAVFYLARTRHQFSMSPHTP